MPLDLTRGQAATLLLCLIALGVHQAMLWDWYIDDAVISFAYARNVADGHGLVATVGGERVEGYSNATWVAVLAIAHLVGLNIWITAKVLCWALTAGFAVVAWWLAREALDGRGWPAMLAPLCIAGSAQAAIWGASGLENALFGFLLLLGIARTLVEARTGRGVLAPVLFLLLSATRPDGIAYAALGGLAYMVISLHRGHGWRPTARWLAVFWLPWLAYNTWRYLYFAWALPNTYYAKLGTTGSTPFKWWGPGWGYVRAWAAALGHGWLLPVYIVGVTGLRGRSGRIGLGALAAASVVLLWPGPELLRAQTWWPSLPTSSWWISTRLLVLGAIAAFLPLTRIGERDGAARALCWWSVVGGVGFAVYANGDWMQGFRWMSLLAGPMAVLFAVGVTLWSDAAQRAFGRGETWAAPAWLVAAVLAVATLPVNVAFTNHFAKNPEDGPALIRNRIRYMKAWQHRLHLDRITNLDMDMGAHLWDTDWDQVDVAGLVDVPIAHHTWDESQFSRHYALVEHQPDFAHLHRFWAKHTRLQTYPEWREFVALPPYPDFHGPHDGVWLHRRHLVAPTWEHPEDRAVDFGGGVSLEGFDLAGPEAEPGRFLHLETAWSTLERSPDRDFEVVAYLSRKDGRALQVWSLDLAYGLLQPHEWPPSQVVRTHHSLRLRQDLPEGTYDLGFAVFSAGGTVLRVGGTPRQGDRLPTNAETLGPRLVRGEVRFPSSVRVGPEGTVTEAAALDHDLALTRSAADDCAGAEEAWRDARLHVPRNIAWHEQRRAGVATALAACWGRTADGDLVRLARGHAWDSREPTLRAAADAVAAERFAAGIAARDAGHWAAAYAAFKDVLRVAPHRAWARRYAEEARDRLGS